MKSKLELRESKGGITGAPASLLPIDAIQEFNLEAQIGAEYGRNTGSTVNVFTKSGSNQLHGSVFEYVRNSALDARNFFNPAPYPKTAFRNSQFGGSLGGPLVRDRTFFFPAYEGQRERVGSDFNLLVPSSQAITRTKQVALSMPVSGITAINPALEKVPFQPSELCAPQWNPDTGHQRRRLSEPFGGNCRLDHPDPRRGPGQSGSGWRWAARASSGCPPGFLGSLLLHQAGISEVIQG